MSSRRPASPTGRRFEDPARSSAGSLYKSYDTPSNYTTREMYTSPRASGDRVVPISKETYVNGKLVESSRDHRPSHEPAHHDRHHLRRSTYDQDPRAPPSSSAHLRPAVTHADRGGSADRSSTYDDRYSVSSASSAPRKESRKLYSVDDGKATRLPGEQELRRRDDRIQEKLKQPPDERSKGYHLRGSTKSSTANEPGYEYTDARGMYDTTEPKRRPRRGSVDAVSRERPASMIDPYQTAPRISARESGPPPSMRGFDKVNNAHLGRSGSLQGPYQRSPSRSRGFTTSSTFSDDENYRVPPRITTTRGDDSSQYSGPRSAGILSPTRAGADDYNENRRRSRFEDREVASRGFGIRAPSVDARSSGDSGLDKYGDKYGGQAAEPLMLEAPPASRREYPVEPRAAIGDDARLRDPDWREYERLRERERDRDIQRSPRESPPLRDREPLRERERDVPRERDVIRDREREAVRERDVAPVEKDREYGHEGTKSYEDPRRVRERDVARVEKDREYGPPEGTKSYEDPRRIRDRDVAPVEKDREYGPQESPKSYEDSRRDRERDRDGVREKERLRPELERDYDRYSDDDRRPRERRPERDYYDDDRREKDTREYRDEPELHDHHHDHHHAAEAIAGTAAAGAAALGAKELYNKRPAEERRDIREDREPVVKPMSEPKRPYEDRRDPRDDREVDRKVVPESRDTRAVQPGSREEPPYEEKTRGDREPVKRYDDDDGEDVGRPRRRNYVSKDKVPETASDAGSKHSEILDPEEDYRRRVQQVQQEMGRAPAPRHDEDPDRERRRREREEAHENERRREREQTRETERRRDDRAPASDAATDYSNDSQASTRFDTQSTEITESPQSEEPSEGSEASDAKRKKRVSIVDPPKEQKAPKKSILRRPTDKFPEEKNPIREGVAPLKDAKAANDKNVPPDARWTKIARSLVNSAALEEKGERFEERDQHVIVLRVLTKEQIQKFADRTKEIRDSRYAERKEAERKDRKDHRSTADEKEHDGRRGHDHDRRDKDLHTESDPETEREGRDKASVGARTGDRYKPEGY